VDVIAHERDRVLPRVAWSRPALGPLRKNPCLPTRCASGAHPSRSVPSRAFPLTRNPAGVCSTFIPPVIFERDRGRPAFSDHSLCKDARSN
jgi:hypothetical protein